MTEATPGVFTVAFEGSLFGFAQQQMTAAITSGSGTNPTVAMVAPGSGGTIIESGAAVQIAGDNTIAGEPLMVNGTGTSTAPSVPTQWFSVGPAPINNGETAGNQSVSGRVTGVVADPNDPNIIYISSAGGGAWKTIDGGQTWYPHFRQHPRNPDDHQ